MPLIRIIRQPIWTALHANIPAASDKKTATVRNVAVDDSVFLTIANKEVATCQSRDTMPVYLYPEAPTLRIDTVDGSFVNAGLYLDGGSGDNYTIWSRKWDPYCLTDRFTGDQVYKKEPGAINITDKLWKEPAMDTLEFYYATAGRTIAGRTWDSPTTSDTVGYYLQDINKNTTSGKTSNNLVPVYFDFTKMGYPTSGDLLKLWTSKFSVVRTFNYSTQGWSGTTNPAGSIIIGSFTIVQGTVIQIEPKINCQFMQYGKLPSLYDFSVNKTNATSKGNNNLVFLQPSRAAMLMAREVLDEVVDLSTVRYFGFDNQGWNAARYVTSTVFLGDFSLIPLLPLQMELKAAFNGSINWK